MTATISDDDAPIRDALERLAVLIQERVRRERLRDQLTGLHNDLALTELFERLVTSERGYWAAFIEVDKFKSINDRFGYPNADLLLQQIADAMRRLAEAFGEGTEAFRAHGDEFYFAGSRMDVSGLGAEVVSRNLELARETISKITIDASDDLGAMTCTVSIGWLVGADLAGVVTERHIRDRLERAVDVAKQRGRNTVVRYTTEMERRATSSYRADCSSCLTKFTFDVPVDAGGGEPQLHCPHCHAEVTRPASTPAAAPAKQPAEV